MNQYHKIQSVFKRDLDTKYKTLLEGQYSIPEFEYLKDNQWVWTEKVDGMNIRVIRRDSFLSDDEISFVGKTDKAQLPGDLMGYLQRTFIVDAFKEVFSPDADICLYGEGYGPKIQSGGKYRATQAFVLFDVKVGDWWLKREDVGKIANDFDIAVVPIIGVGTLSEMVAYTKFGFKSAWGDFIAEGIVARPIVELKTRSGERVITKIKYEDFQGVTGDK